MNHQKIQFEDGSRKSLGADTRGAILVLGVVMGAFLVGALWHIVGLGNAIIWREEMQNAADAGAMSNAVWHARGMNALVGLNIIMSGVMAVLVIWRTFLLLVTVALVISGIICIVTLGAGCGFTATLANVEARMLQIEARGFPDKIIQITEVIHIAQSAVATVTPVIAFAESSLQTKSAYDLDSSFAFSMSSIPSPTCGDGVLNCFQRRSKKKPGGSGGANSGKGGNSGTGSGGGANTNKGGSDGSGGGSNSNKGGSDGSGGGVNLNKGGTSGSGGGVNMNKGGTGGTDTTTPECPTDPKENYCGITSQKYIDFRDFFMNPRIGFIVSLPAQYDDFEILCKRGFMFLPVQVASVLEEFNQDAADGLREAAEFMGNIAQEFPQMFCMPMGHNSDSVKKRIVDKLDERIKKHCESEWDTQQTKADAGAEPSAGDAGSDAPVNLTKPESSEDKDDAKKKQFVDDCIKKKSKETKDKVEGSMHMSGTKCPELEMQCSRPVKVWDWAANGSLFMRSFAFADDDAPGMGFGDRGIEVADISKKTKVESAKLSSIDAHAEFYYDCDKGWDDCSSDAMWNLAWRARLRRVQPFDRLLVAGANAAVVSALTSPISEVINRLPTTEYTDVVKDFVSEKISNKIGDWVKWDAGHADSDKVH